MKKFVLVFVSWLCVFGNANAIVLSRIDVTGNQRMDEESVRILSGVKRGDNINNEQANTIAKIH